MTFAALVGEDVTLSLMDNPSLDHMVENDPKGVYIGRGGGGGGGRDS